MLFLKRYYSVFATIMLNTLMLFVVIELVARVVLFNVVPEDKFLRFKLPDEWPKAIMRLQPHPYLSYVTRPNYSFFDGQKRLPTHNSLGFRGSEISKIKEPGVFRIAAIGGSTTYSSGTNNESTYPLLLEKALRNKYGYQQVEVINAGVPGYTSWESLVNFQFRVLDLNPDLIIIYHGTNDTHSRLVSSSDYRADNTGSRKHWENPVIPFWEHSVALRIFSRLNISSPASERDFTGALTALNLGQNPLQTLILNPLIYFKRNISSLVAIANQNKIKVMFATWASSKLKPGYGNLDYYQKGFSEAINVTIELGEELSVPVFEFHKYMPHDAKYWSDSVHVNKLGSAIKADLFAKYINEVGLIEGSN